MKFKKIKKAYSFLVVAGALVSMLDSPAPAQRKIEPSAEIVASGGAYVLEKTVAAGGGNVKQAGAVSEAGTTGQTIAGAKSTGGQFALHSGFWTPDDFAPTAAHVVLGGRILTAAGLGIRNAQITITFPTGETRAAKSTAFGY
ncbi:MAG TPA: hypothetical protein VIL74_14885, partial [Pyrinomonadaceae bacterium]